MNLLSDSAALLDEMRRRAPLVHCLTNHVVTNFTANVLLAAEMSWIQVKRGDADGAFKTLTEALKKSDDATLKRNHECLMNNRVGHFSNSGLGDQWYSLLLEEPKVHVQRQRSVYR